MTDLYSAYLRLYVNKPMLANEAITGAAIWPPEDSPDDLMRQADNLVSDADGLVSIFPHHDATWLTKCRAARDAIQAVFAAEEYLASRGRAA